MAEEQTPEIKMDASELYREEVFTDQRIGSLRVLTPVNTDGSTDDSRDVMYIGSASLMTPAGSIPLNFEIEADSLAAAVEAYGEAAKKAFEETVEELKEMRRQAASSIVVPQGGQGGVPGGGPGGPAGAGGIPGGGIQMP